MPLLDHFRPPLSLRRHWHSFHNSWATYLSSQLNRCLPEGYFAEANVQFGIEIDVAAFGEEAAANEIGWAAPEAKESIPMQLLSDSVEISIFSRGGGPTLAGAIELVSPSNKDRPAHRDALVSKCAAYLQGGIGLVLVDVVTERGGDIHRELLLRLGATEVLSGADLFAAAYRPVERDGQPSLDLWHEPLAVGGTLPTLPLWLRGGLCLPVELEETYERTRSEQRVRGESA
jgi:hypothetical protein